MEILLLVVCVLIASADGFVAIYSALGARYGKSEIPCLSKIILSMFP